MIIPVGNKVSYKETYIPVSIGNTARQWDFMGQTGKKSNKQCNVMVLQNATECITYWQDIYQPRLLTILFSVRFLGDILGVLGSGQSLRSYRRLNSFFIADFAWEVRKHAKMNEMKVVMFNMAIPEQL